MPHHHVKHGKYVLELKTGFSGAHKEIEYPQWAVMGDKDLNGVQFSIGTSLLTKPFLMIDKAHSHDFNQILFFINSDPKKVTDFDAEVEMTLVETSKTVKHLINYAACVNVPAGTIHGPLNIRKVNKPIIFIDVTLTHGFSTPDVSKYVELPK